MKTALLAMEIKRLPWQDLRKRKIGAIIHVTQVTRTELGCPKCPVHHALTTCVLVFTRADHILISLSGVRGILITHGQTSNSVIILKQWRSSGRHPGLDFSMPESLYRHPTPQMFHMPRVHDPCRLPTPITFLKNALNASEILFSNLKLISRAFEEGLNSGRGVSTYFDSTSRRIGPGLDEPWQERDATRTQMMSCIGRQGHRNRTKDSKGAEHSGETQDYGQGW